MCEICTATVLLFLPILSATPHCTQYGVCKNFEYVPAPPGRTPSCAKPGSTYCESVEHYPKQLIRYLIEKWGYDYNTLLSDESKDEFGDRRPLTYGPRPQELYGPPPVPQVYYGAPPLIQPAISFGPISSNVSQSLEGGYPDRRYKIDPQILTNALQQPPGYSDTQFVNKGTGGFSYSSTVVQPNVQPVQSVQWWKRYKRSRDERNREKRQAPPGGSTTLCPTQPSFIMPRAALNTRGNWMYTVNLNEVDDRYTQLVRSETCISNQCNGLCSLPNGYTSRCEQQYVQKRLVALEGNGERLYSDTFWFPHCCVCQITSN